MYNIRLIREIAVDGRSDPVGDELMPRARWTVPRGDRLVLLAGLAAVLGLAWLWLLLGAGMDMTAIEMTRMAGMDGWLMQPAVWSAGYATLMFAMWWVMMVAMMLPSAAPTLLLFLRINRNDKGGKAPVAATSLFAAGYLIAWGGFSILAVALQWALESVRLLSPMLATSPTWLGAGILIAAGLWQLTPLKTVCLRHCRSPLGFLLGNWRAGPWGALNMGLALGAYCLGCCWFLMALLFFGGVMNLYWIVGLAGYVMVEKMIPLGHWLQYLAGIALILWGLALALI
jgi:predicted metal-binding membrane protein